VWVAAGSGDSCSSSDGVTWTKNTGPFSDAESGIYVPSLNKWFMVTFDGAPGSVYSSTDGTTWTVFSKSVWGSGIAYINGALVVCGNLDVPYSLDGGVSWHQKVSNTNPRLGGGNEMIFANGKFILVSNDAVLWTSTDGITWDATYITTGTLQSIKWSNEQSLYVAGCSGGRILTSTDLVTWTSRTSTLSGNVTSIDYSPTQTLWVAVSAGGGIATSPDGTTWTSRSITVNGLTIAPSRVNRVYWFSAISKWILLAGDLTGNSTNQAPGIYTSTNGTTWTTLAQVGYFNQASHNNISVANSSTEAVIGGPGGLIFRASDTERLRWKAIATGLTTDIVSVCYGGSKFVAVTAAGTTARSTDGITWTTGTVTSPSGTFNRIYPPLGDSNYRAISTAGIWTSSDAITWTNVSSETNIKALAYSSSLGLYVYVSTAGALKSSTNGTVWTTRTSGFGATTISDVVWSSAKTLFVAIGDTGKISTSPDGTTWTLRTTPGTNTLTSIDYSTTQGLFLVGHTSNGWWYSSDGTTWTAKIGGSTNPFVKYLSGSDMFLVIGNGTLCYTRNGNYFDQIHQPGYTGAAIDKDGVINIVGGSQPISNYMTSVTNQANTIFGGYTVTTTDGTTFTETRTTDANGFRSIGYRN
jgi:hypothetical protein